MKKLLLLLLLIVTATSCGEKTVEPSPGLAVISGQITRLGENSSRVVAIHFMNPLDASSTKAAQLDSNGHFRISYEMPYGQSVNIQYGEQFFTLYAEPGDNIHVTIDAEKIAQRQAADALVYGGDNADLNKEFTPAYARFTAEIYNDFGFYDDGLEPEAFLEAVQNRIKTSRDSLAAYAGRENMSGKAKELVDHEIMTAIVYNAAWYREGDEGSRTAMEKLFLPEIFDVFDSRYSSSQLYSSALNGYLTRCVYGTADFESREGTQAFLQNVLNRIQAMPKGLSRDLMLYGTFSQTEMLYSGISKEFPELRPLFASEYVATRLDLAAKHEIPVFERTPISGISRIDGDFEPEPLPPVDIFEYLSERHPGKVVYIDISAHWCGPCLVEFPHLKDFHRSLEGEEVAYVILWMNSAYDRCVSLMKQYEMTEDCYFFSDDAYLLFRGTYGFVGFPTYMLMDKNGKLANLHAGRPSDPNTAAQIRELP